MEQFTVKAPTRADLSGGTLDIWPINCLFDGTRTINVALDLYERVHFDVVDAGKFQITLQGVDDQTCVMKRPLAMEEAHRLPPSLQFPVAVASAYLRRKNALPKKEIGIRISTEVPRGSGLGGSSSLCVAIARGFARLFGDYGNIGWQWDMLRWVRDVEASFLKVPTGEQDYLAAIFGGLRCYEFLPGQTLEKEYSLATLKEFSKRALVLYSGQTHHSGMSNWEIYKSVLDNQEKLVDGFRKMKGLSDFLDEHLSSEQPDWSQVGRCLNEDWEIRKSAFGVNTKRLDEIMAFLDSLKLLGRKVCGAANGGCLLVLAEPDALNEVRSACEKEGIQILPTIAVKQGVHIEIE